jgi:hypothetical protein
MRTIWTGFTLVELAAALLTLGSSLRVAYPEGSELGYALPKCRTAGTDEGSVRWTTTTTAFRAVVDRVLNGCARPGG